MNIETLYNAYKESSSVSTDTRKLIPGSIFFALKGANFNGNLFAQKALESGCLYVVVDEEVNTLKEKTFRVENVLQTLQDLASYHRKKLGFKIVAATGSNGKTTSKELIHKVLSKKYNCYSTPGNFNNHIGLPLSILQVEKDCDIAILEMGDNKRGDVTELCHIAYPDYGFVTNIGKDHLEGFGSMKGNILAKKEIFDFLSEHNGNIFLDTNDELVSSIATEFKSPITYGTNGNFSSINYQGANPYIVYTSEDGTTVKTNLIGEYNFNNIQLAFAIGKYFKVEENLINEAIVEYSPTNNRSQLVKTENNLLIMDAYNANPSSVEKALDSFSSMKVDLAEKWVILGDMLELGQTSKEEHQNIVNHLKMLNFNKVILIGKEYSTVDSPESYYTFSEKEKAADFIRNTRIKNSSVLLKGSRGIKLETLQDLL